MYRSLIFVYNSVTFNPYTFRSKGEEPEVAHPAYKVAERKMTSIKATTIIFLTVLFFGLVSSFADGLTLDEAKEIALKNNPSLKAAVKAKESAYWDAKKSIWGVLPSAQASGGYSAYDPAISTVIPDQEKKSSSSLSVSITQPVYNGRKGIIGIHTGRENEKITEYTLEQKMLETIAGVETRYFAVLENKSLMEIAYKDLEAARENTATARVRYSLGTLSKADFLNVQSQASSKEVAYIQSRSNYEISRRDIANFLHVSSDFTLEPVDFSLIDTFVEQVSALDDAATAKIATRTVSLGLTKNPSLKISSATVKINELALAGLKQEFFPSVNLSFTNSWDKSDLEQQYTYQGVITLYGSLPLFPIIDTLDEVRGSASSLEEARDTYESAKDEVVLSVQSAVYALVTAARSIDSSHQAAEYARETYEQMKTRFESGVVSSTDLLNTEILLTSAESQYTTARYNFLRAESSLMKQLGLRDKKTLHELFTEGAGGD